MASLKYEPEIIYISNFFCHIPYGCLCSAASATEMQMTPDLGCYIVKNLINVWGLREFNFSARDSPVIIVARKRWETPMENIKIN